MKSSESGAYDVLEKAEKILAGAKTVYLATNGEHGHPNLRAMMPCVVEGVRTLWFASSAESNKVRELSRDNHAVIYAEAPRAAGECRLWGYADVLDDAESRDKVWNETTAAHSPDGKDSPGLRAIRFTVVSGTYTNKNMETFQFSNE